MAKKSMINRELKREKMVAKYAEKRIKLKETISDMTANDETRMEAMLELQALPRNSSPVRLRNRCAITGRPHGYFRKFGLSRNMLRERVMQGDVPGVRKASYKTLAKEIHKIGSNDKLIRILLIRCNKYYYDEY